MSTTALVNRVVPATCMYIHVVYICMYVCMCVPVVRGTGVHTQQYSVYTGTTRGTISVISFRTRYLCTGTGNLFI